MLHVRPRMDESWIDTLEAEVIWDEDLATVCLSDGPLDALPTLVLSDEDAPRLFDQGYAGVLSVSAAPETVLAGLIAVDAGLQVCERVDDAHEDRPVLTPREQEVIELLAQGFSNREIGEHLQISAHTAKFHVQALLEKLDATTRTEAAVRAARWFLV